MVLRITTWNVNGIRNPFGYQPWRDRRTFDGMFDILEADIVVMQELKIQRKDLRDDMVLVPGWDCYFSLPKHKKGYSGVGIYTRQSVCAPIRAEEGVLGVLSPPNSSTAYRDLPADKHIGGYLSETQLIQLDLDATELDSEGRCVIVEFPAFVLFGIYSPANSSGLRSDFRYGFLNALDMRVRNLIAEGKRVIVTGDLNVSRDEFDTAGAFDHLRKDGITHDQYISTPNRRIFNQLLEGGEVFGERDQGRELPVMWDICRGFHPTRTGMFTHWEQKINARPGNFGSRIDFVLCSLEMKSWFCESNIQEGLMGSDHCPVYAELNDEVDLRGTCTNIKDIMNAPGTFVNGGRLKQYSVKDIPSFSGKLLPEFDKRRSIKDMFGKKPSLLHSQSSVTGEPMPDSYSEPLDQRDTARSAEQIHLDNALAESLLISQQSPITSQSQGSASPEKKRKASETVPSPAPKRTKSATKSTMSKLSNGKASTDKNQQSLKGFLTKTAPSPDTCTANSTRINASEAEKDTVVDATVAAVTDHAATPQTVASTTFKTTTEPMNLPSPKPSPTPDKLSQTQESETKFVDPIVSKESWSRMFTKPVAPRCEHGEACKTMKTKKPGFNCGRDFWMCQRPLGPSGTKERGTQWRCSTFIWGSDWNGSNEQQI